TRALSAPLSRELGRAKLERKGLPCGRVRRSFMFASMPSLFRKSIIAGGGITVLAIGCGGVPGSTPPDAPTAAEATGRLSVKAVEGPSSPLIVDWKAEQRADLEEVIADGVAIVAWDDQGLRLLRRCRLDGEYGYL